MKPTKNENHLTPEEWNNITEDLLRLCAQIQSFNKKK